MFGVTPGSMLILYLVNIGVTYSLLAGFAPSLLGGKIDYRGKGFRLMVLSVLWLPIAVASLLYVTVRKNRQIDEMYEELNAKVQEQDVNNLKPKREFNETELEKEAKEAKETSSWFSKLP